MLAWSPSRAADVRGSEHAGARRRHVGLRWPAVWCFLSLHGGGQVSVVRGVGAVVLVLAAFCADASAQVCAAECRQARIDDYFERLSVVYRRGSTSEDIDRLFELFAPTVRYVHKAYDASFDRDAWKAAFTANLERGAYSKGGNELIERTKLIDGRHHSAVAYRYMRRMDDGTLRPADAQ